MEYWSQYYKVFNSAADVYSLITVADGELSHAQASLTLVRQTLNAQPVNLSHLILALSYHLFTLLPSTLFPTPSSNSSQQNTTQEALNCLRVLGRVLVVVYENDAERKSYGLSGESFAQTYLWKRSKVTDDQAQMALLEPGSNASVGTGREVGGHGEGEHIKEATQFEIGDDDDDDEEAKEEDSDGDIGKDEGARAFKATLANPTKAATNISTDQSNGTIDDPLTRTEDKVEDEAEEATGPCLVDRLFSCTIDLLFCAGFTVPESVKGTESGEKINVSVSCFKFQVSKVKGLHLDWPLRTGESLADDSMSFGKRGSGVPSVLARRAIWTGTRRKFFVGLLFYVNHFKSRPDPRPVRYLFPS